jgi:hypothetical protein
MLQTNSRTEILFALSDSVDSVGAVALPVEVFFREFLMAQ